MSAEAAFRYKMFVYLPIFASALPFLLEDEWRDGGFVISGRMRGKKLFFTRALSVHNGLRARSVAQFSLPSKWGN